MTASIAGPTVVQQQVIEQPVDRKTLVTAGAGTGKTFTLVRRIEHLLAERLDSGALLVLTFSRAAFAELRGRLHAAGGGAAHVRVATFDAWALQLLREGTGDEAWTGRTFDERITAATGLVEDESTAPESLEDVLHVVIDEVQDLVGVRRQLVQTFLDAYECGFTVVGDPAQAIYGFQVPDPQERAAETARFFSWLRTRFEGELTEFTLDDDFRAVTDEARCARPHEAAVRSAATSAQGRDAYEELRLELAARMDFGDPQVAYVRRALESPDLETAVLCATNGQALLVSRWLADLGVHHVVRRGARELAAPSWIALVARALGGARTATQGDFLRAWAAVHGPAAPEDGERAWRQLLRVAGDRGRRGVDLSRLHRAVAFGDLPDELGAQAPGALVVSTFHRAKGLEFDRVLIVDPGQPDDRPETVAAERCDAARALYVAMTRAREELYRLTPPEEYLTRPGGFALVRKVKGSERWGRYGYKAYQRSGLSALEGDVHRAHPAGLEQIDCDPQETQDYLAGRVGPGDEIVWSRLDDTPVDHDDRTAPGYALLHEGRAIGVASETFRRGLYGFMQQRYTSRPSGWPRTISGLRVDVVETVAGEHAAASRAGLGPRGLWLAPRPTGIGRFAYDREDKDA
ncbi:UvrD-like helicase family protein [Streptomyces sp. 1114.5]|nr:UvrD-like helicase family protein [Streptomyces sp. 1114.5]